MSFSFSVQKVNSPKKHPLKKSEYKLRSWGQHNTVDQVWTFVELLPQHFPGGWTWESTLVRSCRDWQYAEAAAAVWTLSPAEWSFLRAGYPLGMTRVHGGSEWPFLRLSERCLLGTPPSAACCHTHTSVPVLCVGRTEVSFRSSNNAMNCT